MLDYDYGIKILAIWKSYGFPDPGILERWFESPLGLIWYLNQWENFLIWCL